MDCDAASKLLSGWIDGQLAPGDASALEAHLATCAECRGTADALRHQDADLRRAFQSQRAAAERVATGVIETLRSEPLPTVGMARSAGFRWQSLLLAAAAGFLLAAVLFQPWRRPAAPPSGPPEIAAPPAEKPVARLVVATGNVEMRPSQAADWQCSTKTAWMLCPSSSIVKTGPDVRCELKTADGCVIRLNQNTEITLASPTEVEIQCGQIWCSSPKDVSLKIVAAGTGLTAEPKAASPWSAACPSNSCVTAAIQPGSEVQVTASAGEAELTTPHESRRLQQGESAAIVGGEIVRPKGYVDPVLSAGWIHTLLVRKGYGDAELASRIRDLLAQVGRSKIAYLYEQEIRGLGEYSALPLLRYVESPMSAEEPNQRLTAMRILSDIAPSWLVPDLIKLLSDKEPDIRVLSARALERLTSLDQGRPPAQWREPLEKCAPTIELWRAWWTENQQQFPPPAKISRRVEKSTSREA